MKFAIANRKQPSCGDTKIFNKVNKSRSVHSPAEMTENAVARLKKEPFQTPKPAKNSQLRI